MNSLKYLTTLSVIALVLNMTWEFSHYSLYIDLSGIPSNFHLIIASFADMILLMVIYIGVSAWYKSFNWLNQPTFGNFAIVALLGITIAIIIEVVNLKAGRWAYTSAMPTFFGVGLSPLVQLGITGIASLIIAQRFGSRK